MTFEIKLPATVYDPRRVIVTFGPLPLRGYAPGRFISVRRDAPTWSTIDGTNGEFKRRRSKRKSGTVELTLRGTTPTNKALGIIASFDEGTGNVISKLAITDTLNGAIFFSGKAYIETFPDMAYGQQEGDVTWRFRCDDLKPTYPGLSAETLALRIGSS